MGDKSSTKTTHNYLRRSSTSIASKITPNKITQNVPKSNKHINPNKINTTNQHTPTNQNTSHTNENLTQKTFAETTANLTFPKKNQAIIFNTIDGIPQIEYLKAFSLITNPSNIKFASRISNNRFCIYFANSNIVNDIINNYSTITVDNHNIDIRRLENQAKRIIISNVSPIIPHTSISDALNRIGIKTITPITFLKAGFPTEELSHIISFRRQTYIQFEDISKLPGSILIHFEDTDYRIFLTDDILTCYLCKRTGHTSAYCKNATEHNKNPHPNQDADISLQPELDITSQTYIINKNNSETSNTEENHNTNLKSEQTLTLEKPNLNSITISNEHQQTNLSTDSFQEDLPSTTTPIIQTKRPISNTSSLKSPTQTLFPSLPSPTNIESIKSKNKKPKIRSRSNSSTRSNVNKEEALNPIENFFSDSINPPINFLQFKYILEQSISKHINIHTLCDQVNIDIKSLINLVEEIRPHIKERALKSRLTKFAHLLFQILPPEDTQTTSSQ